MSIRADDGTLLHAKEAIVVDQNGEPIAGPSKQYQEAINGRVRIFQMNQWFTPIFITAAVVMALALGTVFVGALAVIIISLGVVRFIKKLLS